MADGSTDMLPARAGEESRVEGMDAGADHYLVKPFSARELLGRVGARLQRARIRRGTRHALRESESRFRSIFDSAQFGIALIDSHSVWLDANPALCGLLGIARADLVGRTHPELIPPEYQARRDEARAQLERVGHWRGEYALLRADGQPLVFDWQSTVLPESGLRLVVAQDITDRLQAERALRRSHGTFFNLIQNAPFGVYIVDSNFRLAQVSVGSQKVFNNVRPLIGRDFAEVLRIVWPEPFASEAIGHFKYTLATGEPHHASDTTEQRGDVAEVESYEWRLERITLPDGQFGVVCYFYDFTDRNRLAAALRESEQRFKTMANTAPAMLWITETDGSCSFLSRGWYEYTGQTEAVALGFGWTDAVHPDDRAGARDAFVEANARHETFALEHRLRRADGEYRWVIDSGRPRLDPQGVFMGFIGAVIEIEDRKRLEETLRERAEQLVEADRRKDEFLAILAHELRNPLAPIRQAAKIATLPNATPSQVAWSHGVVDRQVQHMALLLDDLLDVSRITRGKLELRKERIDLKSAVEVAVETALPTIEARRHELVIELPHAPVWIYADPLRIAQVLANLLTNAAKYTQPEGSIRVSVQPEGDEVAVRVIDTGIGIEADALPHVFEMFSQVTSAIERAEGGLGIGLALVRGLVTLHGGSVAAYSEGSGRGSTFVVRLPMAEPESAEIPAPLEDAAKEGEPRCRILIADDNRDAAESLAIYLELRGHTIKTAHDGLEALQVVESFRPEIALLDIGMPKLNGYELAQRIRQQAWGVDTVLVAITGWGQDEDKRRAITAGFDHHLTKPVDIEALHTLLASRERCA